jgi:hypothetical protein
VCLILVSTSTLGLWFKLRTSPSLLAPLSLILGGKLYLDKHASLLRIRAKLQKNSWVCIHNNQFSLQCTNRPNKLTCFITLGWKGLQETNTLAYWAHLNITKKMKCREYGPCVIKLFTAVIISVPQ